MKISIGCDHAGFPLKAIILPVLADLGHLVVDFGTDSEETVDYPDFIGPAAEAVARREADLGIVIGGSGNGEAMAANKVPGVRAALCMDVTMARLAREHNDANVLALGERIIGSAVVEDIVRTFMTTAFSGVERHERRIKKMAEMERKYGSHL